MAVYYKTVRLYNTAGTEQKYYRVYYVSSGSLWILHHIDTVKESKLSTKRLHNNLKDLAYMGVLHPSNLKGVVL